MLSCLWNGAYKRTLAANRKESLYSGGRGFPLSLQPVLHDWCNKGRGMCYPVCGMVHIKEPLLLIGKRAYIVVAEDFLSRYLNDPLLYVLMPYN